MQNVINKWNKYWFEPRSYINLCFCRLLFFTFLLKEISTFHMSYAFSYPPEVYDPISFFQFFPLWHPSQSIIQFLELIWKTSAVFAAVGFLTKYSTKAVALLNIIGVGYQYNFGKISHAFHLMVLCSFILSFSRCGDFISVDYLIKKYILKKESPDRNSSAYNWPIRLIRNYMVWIYFSAGVQKLKNTGFAWIYSDSMSVLLTSRPTVTRLGEFVAGSWLLSRLSALFIMVTQLGAPLAAFHWKFALLFVPAFMGFHTFSYILMGNHGYFFQYVECSLFWIPWDRIYFFYKSHLIPYFSSYLLRPSKSA